MADETITLSIELQLAQLREELAKIPGMTKAETEKMVKALEKQLKKAEAASKKAAAAMKKANDEAFRDIKQGAEKVFGGVVGDIHDIGKGLKAIGPAGAAAAAGMAAVAAVEYGLFKAGEAAFHMSLGLVEADKKLENLYLRGVPGFTRASEEALQASRELNAAFVVLDQTSTQLSVTVGNEFAPAFNSASDDVVAFTLIANDATKALFDSTYAMDWILTTAENVFPTTVTLMDAWKYSTVEYRDQAEKMIQTEADKARITEINTGLQKIAIEKTKELDKATQEAEAAEREREKALREQEAAQRKAIAAAEERNRVEQQLNDTLNGMFTEFLDPLQQIDEKYDELGDKVKKLGGSESDLAQVEMARHLAKMKHIDEEVAKVKDAAARTAKATAPEEAADEEIPAVEKARVQWEEMYEEVSKLAGDLMDAQIDRQARKHEAAKEEQFALEEKGETVLAQLAASRAEAEGKKLEKLAAFRKKAAIMEAAVQAALAIARGAPNPIAMAAGGVAGGFAVAAAANAQVPTFHTGGIAPDEFVARKNESLAVMTRQARQNGGEQALARMNRGESSGQVIEVTNRYGHKVFDTFVDDNVRMSGSALRKATKGDRKVGHRVRR